MARRGHRTKVGDLIVMAAVGVILYVGVGDPASRLAWGLIAISVLLVWITLFMPTYCDVETTRGRGCRRPAYGKLRACRTHAREKRDAVFGLFNLRTRAALSGDVVFRCCRYPQAWRPCASASHVPARRIREVTMLFAALVSAGAGVLALL